MKKVTGLIFSLLLLMILVEAAQTAPLESEDTFDDNVDETVLRESQIAKVKVENFQFLMCRRQN